MKRLQERARIYLTVILLFVFSHCLFANNKPGNIPDTINIIGNKYCPPYDMIDENGKPEGFCVDLINEVMKRMHKPYKLTMVSRDQIMKYVRSGKADLILEMTYSKEREKSVHFGTVYNYASRGALFRNGIKPINSFQQFRGKTIAVEKNSYSEHLIKRIGAGLKLLAVDDHEEGAKMVKEGKCDAMFCNLDFAQYITRHNADLNCAWIGLPPEKFCLASCNEILLNKVDFVIYQLKKEGVYGQMLNKWMPRDKSEDYLRIIYISLIVIASLLALIAIIYFFLHFKIVNTKKQLQRNQQSLDMSLRAGDIGIWGFDLESLTFNNIFCHIFPPEGRSLDDEIKLIHPEDVDKLKNAIHATALGTPPTQPITIRVDNAKGINWSYIELELRPFRNEEGDIIKIIGTHKDLTERKRLRQQLDDYAFRMKFIMKYSGMLTWTYNPYTKVYKTEDEKNNYSKTADQTDILKLFSGDDLAQMKNLFYQMDQLTIDTFETKVKFDRTYINNKPTYYNIFGIPGKDISGKIAYYLGLSVDITELINIQNNLQHEKEQAQKADKLKSAFLANVSHEIRTPLNAIVGFSDMLQYADNDHDREQFLNIIKDNNDRLLGIINDVLDISKIESGTMKTFIEAVDLEHIFNETKEVFSVQLRKSSSNIQFIYEQQHNSCFINTDRMRFTQVLTNFVTNAIKYTKEGHIRIGYECIDNGVKIFVEDTGQGIPRDRKDSVFDRFEKLDSFIQGTGLGLSICKDIAKMFQGNVGVESDLGKGSTFWMWIPAVCDIK